MEKTVYIKPSKKSKMDRKPGALPKFILLRTLKITVLVLLCLLFLFPVEWMVMSSLKTHEQINAQLSSLQTFLPSFNVKDWVAYSKLFLTFGNFGRAIFNSFLYCVINMVGVLLVNSFAAYALARYKFPGAKVITTIIILLIIVPVETSIIPTYVILHRLGFLQSNAPAMRVTGYLLPGFVSAFYIFMFRSYFLGMPKELEEAAKIDGSSRIKTYFMIIMPLSKAIFATVGIFTFMGQWNEYVFANLMFSDSEYQPLQSFLQLINSFNPKDMSVVMASLTFSTAVIAVVYIFCQRYIIEGVSFSGLK